MAQRLAVIILALIAVLAILGLMRRPAHAALDAGEPAPFFTTEATIGEKVFTFDLAAALKKGPVVLYFFPKAFTKGCTAEAHAFADAADSFKRLGATVIGISKDDVATLKEFSTSECRQKFAVGSDADLTIAKEYDATISFKDTLYANRVSYVISPDDKIAYIYSSLDPDEHVANTLHALEKLKARRRR